MFKWKDYSFVDIVVKFGVCLSQKKNVKNKNKNKKKEKVKNEDKNIDNIDVKKVCLLKCEGEQID